MNLVLLTRLVYLRNDKALSLSNNAGLLALQLGLIAFCFSSTSAFWLVAFLLVVIFGLNLGIESRFKAGWRILTKLSRNTC